MCIYFHSFIFKVTLFFVFKGIESPLVSSQRDSNYRQQNMDVDTNVIEKQTIIGLHAKQKRNRRVSKKKIILLDISTIIILLSIILNAKFKYCSLLLS